MERQTDRQVYSSMYHLNYVYGFHSVDPLDCRRHYAKHDVNLIMSLYMEGGSKKFNFQKIKKDKSNCLFLT